MRLRCFVGCCFCMLHFAVAWNETFKLHLNSNLSLSAIKWPDLARLLTAATNTTTRRPAPPVTCRFALLLLLCPVMCRLLPLLQFYNVYFRFVFTGCLCPPLPASSRILFFLYGTFYFAFFHFFFHFGVMLCQPLLQSTLHTNIDIFSQAHTYRYLKFL